MLCNASERVMTVVWRIVMSDVVWRGGEGKMTVHCWRRCPEGDIRPEPIMSRAFGNSARRLQVTFYKGPESSDLDFWSKIKK